MGGTGIDTRRLHKFFYPAHPAYSESSSLKGLPGQDSTCIWSVYDGVEKKLHRPGIEPGPPAWQASILPLNQRCLDSTKVFAVGRIRTYAPRGKLISSQSP